MAGLAALAACGDTTGPGDVAGNRQISFSVALAATGAAAPAAVSPALSVTQDVGSGNELVIDRVAFVLSEIELEADEAECPEEGDDDDCEELERGPVLVDFEPDADQVERNLMVKEIPDRLVGTTFTELEFELDVPDDDGGDADDDGSEG